MKLCRKCQEDWQGVDDRPCVCPQIDDPRAFVVIISDMGDSIAGAVYANDKAAAVEMVVCASEKRWPDLLPRKWTYPTVCRANAYGRPIASVWRNCRGRPDNLHYLAGF